MKQRCYVFNLRKPWWRIFYLYVTSLRFLGYLYWSNLNLGLYLVKKNIGKTSVFFYQISRSAFGSLALRSYACRLLKNYIPEDLSFPLLVCKRFEVHEVRSCIVVWEKNRVPKSILCREGRQILTGCQALNHYRVCNRRPAVSRWTKKALKTTLARSRYFITNTIAAKAKLHMLEVIIRELACVI